MPIDHKNPNKGTFNYTFQLKQGSPSGPTVLYIPGGPGGDAINAKINIFPTSFNQVYIDPRGVGCNYLDNTLPLSVINQDNHIDDLIEIVKSLNSSQLMIYGISYGTIAATKLAHALESKNIPIHTVVLEGTVGHQNDVAAEKAYLSDEYLTIESRLYERYRDAFPYYQSEKKLFNIDQDSLDRFITYTLLFGVDYVGDFLQRAHLLSQKEILSESEEKQKSSMIEDIYKYGAIDWNEPSTSVVGKLNFFASVRCENLGQARSQEEICQNFHHLEGLPGYDSKNYKLKSPIYYLHSNPDIATPIGGAYYHSQNQNKAQLKVFIESKGYGHHATYFDDQLGPCTPKLFNLFYQLKPSRGDFSHVLDAEGHCL